MKDVLDKLIVKLAAIKAKNFIPSQRKSDTGIGYTLESLLDIPENNLKLPDLGVVEIKSIRRGVSNPVTLFTFNRAAWQMKQTDVVLKYGYIDEDGRNALYCTASSKPNNQGLYTSFSTDHLMLNHKDGTVIAKWKIDDLVAVFKKKMPALIVVSADTRFRDDDIEEFWFNEAWLLTDPKPENFLDLLRKDGIIVDVRIHLKQNQTPRNHGTAFRGYDQLIPLCFNGKRRVL